jgi:hypothetical protein
MQTNNTKIEVTLDGTKYTNVGVEIHGYQDPGAGLALVLTTMEDGYPERLATASVNLSAYQLRPDEACLFIKDYAENEGMLDSLVAAGVVAPTGKVAMIGWENSCKCPEVRFVGDWASLALDETIRVNAERARVVADSGRS